MFTAFIQNFYYMNPKFFKRNICSKVLLVFVFSGFCFLSESQMLETKYDLRASVGFGNLKGAETNLFFPSNIDHQISLIGVLCTRKVLPWLSGGIQGNYLTVSVPNQSYGFISEIDPLKSSLISGGPVLDFHLPYKSSGFFNRFEPRLFLSTLFYSFIKARKIKLNNVIYTQNQEPTIPEVEFNQQSPGMGLTVSPELKYRISQVLGAKIGASYSTFSIETEYDKEQFETLWFEIGLSLNLGKYKQFFL